MKGDPLFYESVSHESMSQISKYSKFGNEYNEELGNIVAGYGFFCIFN